MPTNKPQDDFEKYSSPSPWNQNDDKWDKIRNSLLLTALIIGLGILGLGWYGNGEILNGFNKLMESNIPYLVLGGIAPLIILVIFIINVKKATKNSYKKVEEIKKNYHQDKQTNSLESDPWQTLIGTLKTLSKGKKAAIPAKMKRIGWIIFFFMFILPYILNFIGKIGWEGQIESYMDVMEDGIPKDLDAWQKEIPQLKDIQIITP